MLIAIVPSVRAQSAAYLHYSQYPSLDVAFVEGFRIDSVTTVDVTIIIANDSATTEWLIDEFDFRASLNEALKVNFIMARRSKEDPTQRVADKSQCYDYVVASVNDRRISIYHITDPRQSMAISLAQISKLNKK